MPAAIVITLLAVLCAAGVFVVPLLSRRPDEGWGRWLRSAVAAGRDDEPARGGIADDIEDEVGGLGALYQLSEPGNGYLRPPEDLPEDWTAALEASRAALRRSASRRQVAHRPSHAGS